MRLCLPSIALLISTPAVAAPSVLITSARVFDGSGSAARVRDVLIRGDRIVAVGRSLDRGGVRRIDARGLTLMPGLHDLHTHAPRRSSLSAELFERAYAPSLAAGVTTVVDLSASVATIPTIRRYAAEGVPAPRLRLAVRLAAPGGHGTTSPNTAAITTTVATPAEVRAVMPRLLAARPDVVKVFADGWRYGDPARPNLPDVDLPTLTAIVADAHRAGVEVVTHTVTLRGLRVAVAAGVDAVVHGTGDALIERATIRRMKARGIAYVSTLSAYELQPRPFTRQDWATLPPAYRAREIERHDGHAQPTPAWDARRWAMLGANMRALHRAGVRIGVGTDAGISGVYPGWATIRELRLMTRFGFTPAQALRAATSVSARIIRSDAGLIAPGRRADLILVAGKPDQDLMALYNVRRVFVGGRETAISSATTPFAEDDHAHE